MLAAVLGDLPVAAFEPKLAPIAALLAAGFVIGTFGHIIKSKTLIVIGIGLIFLASLLLPLLYFFFNVAPSGP
jgi:hypothetical protein